MHNETTVFEKSFIQITVHRQGYSYILAYLNRKKRVCISGLYYAYSKLYLYLRKIFYVGGTFAGLSAYRHIKYYYDIFA